MLPHAAHARQVVLELGQLDLELAVGGDGVLGEDVEDQLRPVDHARVERVLEVALLRRRQLVVDEQALGLGRLEALLELLDLALADVGALRRPRPVLDDAAERLDARGARQLLDLGQLRVGIRTLGQHREDEAALRVVRSRLPGTWNHRASMTPAAESPDLAGRTLALVDIASPSREEAAVYDYVTAHVPLERAYDDGESVLYAKRGGRPLVLLAGSHRHGAGAGEPARPDRERRRPRARSDRHEGRPRGDDRARPLGRRPPSSPTTSGSSSSRARSSARPTTRFRPCSRRRRSWTRPRS